MPNTDFSSFSAHLLLLIFVIHDSKLNISGVLGGKCHFGLREISSFKKNQNKTKTFYEINNQDYLIIIIIQNCSPAVLTHSSLPLSAVTFTASSISLTRLYNTQTSKFLQNIPRPNWVLQTCSHQADYFSQSVSLLSHTDGHRAFIFL